MSYRNRTAYLAIMAAIWLPSPSDVALAQGGDVVEVVRVEVALPARRNVIKTLKVPATLGADEQVDLYAKASGYVGKINHDIGDSVRQGDVLVELDVPEMADELAQQEAVLLARTAKVEAMKARATQAERRVDSAAAEVHRYEAQAELSRINLKRKMELHEGRAIPQQHLDEARSAAAVSEAQLQIAQAHVVGAEAELQSARADVQVAQADEMVAGAEVRQLKTLLEYAKVRAPFDGVITMRGVDHGAFVRSAEEGVSQPLLRIANVARIRILLDIPEVDAASVTPGTKVSVVIRTLGDAPIEAEISRTARSIDTSTRTMRVEADLPNPDGRLIPGMYVYANVILESHSNALTIPSKAIRSVEGKTVVLIARDGVAHAVAVGVGHDDGIVAEIVSGLQGDEPVIVSSNSTVASGTLVTVAQPGS